MRKTFTVRAAVFAVSVCVVFGGIAFGISYFTLFRMQKRQGLEMTQAAAASTAASIEGILKLKIEQVQSFSKVVYENSGRRRELSNDQLYNLFAGELREQLYGLSFYYPKAGGGYTPKYISNLHLQRKHSLPDNFLSQLEQVAPIQLTDLAHRETAWLGNRSVAVEGAEAHGVISLGFVAQLPDPRKPKLLVVADLSADFLQAFLKSTESFDLSLVTGTGRIFLHPSATMMAGFAQKAWLQRPTAEGLQSNQVTAHGKEQSLLTWHQTKLDDVFVVARHHEASARNISLAVTSRYTLLWTLAMCAMLGCLSVVSQTWRKKTSDYARAVASLGTDRKHTIATPAATDELMELHQAIETAEKRIAERFTENYERGVSDADSRLAALYRTCFSALPSGEFPSGLEVISIQPNTREWRSDFCDFYADEKSLSLLLGRSNVSGAAGALVGSLLKSTLESLRALQDPNKPLALATFLGAANRVLFRVLEGKVQMKLTALQLDLKTGEFFLTNAGHSAPVWVGATANTGSIDQAVTEGTEQKMFSLQTPPLGLKADVDFRPGTFRMATGKTLVLFTTNRQDVQSTEAQAATEKHLRQFVESNREAGPTEWLNKYQANQGTIDPRGELVVVMLRWRDKVDRLKPFQFGLPKAA